MAQAKQIRLKALSVENFGPYLTQQSLDLDVDDARPLIIVRGENMHGKTSLFNAIKWCLYGSVENRSGSPTPFRELVNTRAARAGTWTMTVGIEFEFDGASYSLERQIQPKSHDVEPQSDEDFAMLRFLRRNGTHLDNVEEEVERLVPREISQFFFFDGEMLGRYEQLLASSARQSHAIKDAIEDILGLPVLDHAITDLESSAKEVGKQQSSLARQYEQSREAATRADALDAQAEAKGNDITDLKEQLSSVNTEIRELETKLSATAGLEKDVESLQSMRERRLDLRQTIEDLEARRRNALSEAWKDVVYQHVQPRAQELEKFQKKAMEVEQEAAKLRGRIEELDHVTNGDPCPVCQRATGDREASLAASQRDALNDQLRSLQLPDNADHYQIATRLSRLRAIKPPNVLWSLKDVEDDLRKARVELADLDHKVKQLSSRIEAPLADSVTQRRQEYRSAVATQIRLEGDLEIAEGELRDLQNQARTVRSQIREGGDPALRRLGRQVTAYQDIGRIFETARDKLRDELRLSVEKDASEIFCALTTDKSYTGLRINENYGLRILDRDGFEVLGRSSGAEQVVALSLIGALNRNAVRSGPIVMDTLLTRLDEAHRKNLLRYLPDLAHQTVIMVFRAEVTVERDLLDDVRDRVMREYGIRQIASDESTVEPWRGGQ